MQQCTFITNIFPVLFEFSFYLPETSGNIYVFTKSRIIPKSIEDFVGFVLDYIKFSIISSSLL